MKNLIDRFSVVATASAIIVATPVKAQAIPITNVEVVNTEAGILLQLDTPSTKTPKLLETRYGNTLAIDIPNTQLQLEESDQFQQNNPAPGIESIEVNQRYANSVRITLVGEEKPPEVSLETNAEGFALQASPEVKVTEEPSATPTPPSPSAEETQEPIELVVTATRTEEETREVPRSVTVIEREEIEDQATLTSNIGDILGKTVPGFGPPNGLVTTLRQSMRGRDFSVLIDGVPQSTNREFLVDLDTIGPSNIERIEVVRGPTAVFGADATGGVINIITRQPEEGEFNASSKVGTTFSLDPFDESVGYNVEQSISGNVEGIDYQLTGSFESTNAFFDAEGDRIARFFLGNSLDERENVNLLGKIGWDINSQERLQFSANYYSNNQDPEFRVPLQANPDEAKALIEPIGDVEIDDPTGGNNLVLNLNYTNEDILGSQLEGQLFYRTLTSRSFPEPTSVFFTDGREIVGRSRLDSETWGGRLEIDTPITEDDRLNVFWGLDYNQENAEQPFDIFDKEAFEVSDGTKFVFEREGLWVPPFTVSNFGVFAQLNWEASDAVIVRGGLRYANINVDVDEFTTFFDSSSQGGEQTLDDVVFNLGTTVDLSDNVNLFANFAQGFSAPDFGRILRFPEFNGVTNFTEDIDITKPQKVDSYELGVRGNWGNVQASVAGFFTYSDLGISLEFDEEINGLAIVRAPKRTYGLEGTIDWQPTDNWQLGSTLTLVDGEEDRDGEGFERLGSRDIQPLKLTGYIQNQTTSNWRNRLQFVLVGDREVDSAIAQEDIESYISFDLISQLDVGNGSVTLGIENLFDNQFFRVNDQEAIQTEGFAIPAPGRTFSINYRVDF